VNKSQTIISACDIEAYFTGRLPAILDQIRNIVDIESPSGDEEASSAIADFIEEQVLEVGDRVRFERIKVAGIGEHVIVRAFRSSKPSVLVLGHTDTVHPIGSKEKNPTRIEGNCFFGCGIFDMKANIILIIETIKFLAGQMDLSLPPITCVFTCDEEIGSPSGRTIIEKEARLAPRCYVFEPSSEGRVKTGRKGTGLYKVAARGIPAHAGLEPERGANAILEIARQIEKISKLNDPSRGTTVNVCTIRGGTATNVIPEFAECTADVRFTSMAAAKSVDGAIRGLRPYDPRISLHIEGGINRPPLERSAEVVNLFAIARSRAAEFDYSLDETQVGGASDGNFVAALGVPVLDGLGVTGDGAHTLNEHILISDLAKRATLATVLLAN